MTFLPLPSLLWRPPPLIGRLGPSQLRPFRASMEPLFSYLSVWYPPCEMESSEGRKREEFESEVT